MKKSIILSGLLLSVALANQQISMENYLNNNNVVDNTKKEYTSEYQDATKIDASKGFFNYKEVVYSRILDYRLNGAAEEKVSVASVTPTFDVKDHQKKLKEERERLEKEANSKTEEAKKGETLYAQGYCRFKNNVEVTRISEYSYLDCEFDDFGQATLAVLVVPDFYARALVAQPLYISYSDGFGKQKRLNTTNGAILNATKTSINIANIVNDYLLEKILASSAYQGATIATNQAKAYLDAKSQARTKEQVTYVNTGDGTTEAVKSTNTDMPEKSDYITGAAVEFISSIVKVIGKSVLSNINYSFKINKNAMVFADVVVSSDTSIENSGGTIKKTKLTNKASNNLMDENGEYNFIPADAELELGIKDNKDLNKEKIEINQGQEIKQ